MELLVKWADNRHADPEIDAAHCYKRGDPVVVMPDGHAWGAEERRPPSQGGQFVILKVPDLAHEAAKDVVEGAEYSPVMRDDAGHFLVVRQRAARVDLDAFGPETLAALARDGVATLHGPALRRHFRHKQHGGPALEASA